MDGSTRGAQPATPASASPRLTRRRFTAGAATLGFAAAAAGFSGCSSGNSKNTAAKPAAGSAVTAGIAAAPATTRLGTPAASATSARTATPVAGLLDSTKGKPGGTLKYYINAYPGALTVIDRVQGSMYGGLVHSSLLAFKWGVAGAAVADFTALETDLAQSLPEQPDTMTYVYKLRPAKFHNGRALTSDDVAYSFNRYATYDKSYNKSIWQVWFDHVETPDPQTVVVKTKFPYADGLVSMGGNQDGFILAKEHEEGPDAATSMLGSGPFMFVSDQAPLQTNFKKNPEYYQKPYPYFDQVQIFSNSDVTRRIADFTSRQVHMPWQTRHDDTVAIKQQRPDAKFETVEQWGLAVFPRNDKPPFNDARVRQALSMSIDRTKDWSLTLGGEGRPDQYFNIIYKEELGTHEPKDLGSAAQYWNYDPQAAKQLLAAAGITQPIETQMSHWDATNSGQWFPDLATLIEGDWKTLGVANVKDNTQLFAQYQGTTAIGQYDGLAFNITTGFNAGSSPAYTLSVQNAWYWGPNGEHTPFNVTYTKDQTLSDLGKKQVQQLKLQDRQQTYQQMEQIIADQQYRICLNSEILTWFFDPSLVNAAMALDLGSRRYCMKWWFA